MVNQHKLIDSSLPLAEQNARQAKIIDALVTRLERAGDVTGSAYSMFQSAVALQAEVWEKTRDLEQALSELGETNTQLKDISRAQEQSQKNLSDVLEVMEEGFALFVDGQLQLCNQPFQKLFIDIRHLIQPGLDFESYIEAVSNSRYLAVDNDAERAAWREMRLTHHGKLFSTFVVALRNDRWCQISERRTSFGNVAILQTDITDIVRANRREKAQLIDEHIRFLQTTIDHIGVGIGTFSATGGLEVYNDRFAEYLQLPRTLVKKRTRISRIINSLRNNQVIDEDAQPIDFRAWLRDLQGGRGIAQRLYRTDGVVLDLRIDRLPSGDFIATVTDITIETQATKQLRKINETLENRVRERTAELTRANDLLRTQYAQQTQVEEDLRLAKEAAEQANFSKTRFLAAASHDLLQPVNAAKLYISMLRSQIDDEQASATAARLDRTFSSMETLLRALLDIARLDSSDPQISIDRIPINRIFAAIAADFAPVAAQKGLQFRVAPSSLWVESDGHYLHRIIQNLVANALQYTDQGRVLLGLRRHGKRAIIQVCDTGIGISPEYRNKIFEEFATIDDRKSRSGMGLGLSIVERACRHLGHQITLHSVPNRGSIFSIELMVSQREAITTNHEIPNRPEPSVPLNCTVLLVENDQEVLEATTQMLESWGVTMFTATSTDLALKVVEQHQINPDLLLVDYHLDDGKDGIEAITRLRTHLKRAIPTIMLTADRSARLRDIGQKMDFSVLVKPVQLSRLRSLLAWETGAAVCDDHGNTKVALR